MANNKASGISLAVVDMVKLLTPVSLVYVAGLISHVFENYEYPKSWENCLLKLLYKGKGDPTQPQVYRPINLTESLFRVTETLLWLRLKPDVDGALGDWQSGFRSQRGTTEELFILRTLLDLAEQADFPIWIAVTDIQKAFDSADHKGIIYKLAQKGASREVCRLVWTLISGHKSFIDLETARLTSCPVYYKAEYSPPVFLTSELMIYPILTCKR